MAQSVRLKKVVDIGTLPFPPTQITRDNLNRVIENRFEYQSIVVYYTVTWEGITNFITTYTQTIEDKVIV
jgi:hypothetical protein